MKNYLEIIKTNPLFQNINDDETASLLKCLCGRIEGYEKNSYIFMEGGKVADIGLVISGRAHIIKDDHWGNRTILAQLSFGEMFGEAFAFAGEEISPVSVIAVDSCQILLINFNKILHTCPSPCGHHTTLINNLIKILAKKNVLLTHKIQFITQKKTREKLLAYLSNQEKKAKSSTFTIPFNRQELADFLSIDRSAMSSELSKMRNEGILEFDKNHFTLK
jgi:CRP-like cAMP-binding protein